MLGVQKSWLSGSSVSAIFLVKTLCLLQPIGVRMWLTDRPNLWVTCQFFFCYHCININIDVRCVVQYFVNITQDMSTMETCFFSVCLFFIFIPFWLHVDNWFPSWHWVKLFPQGKFHNSRHPHSVESELGEISILGELPLLMKLSVTCASNTTLLTDTVLQPQCARGRAVLCFPVSSAYVCTLFKARTGNCVTLHHMAALTLTVSYKFLNNKRW